MARVRSRISPARLAMAVIRTNMSITSLVINAPGWMLHPRKRSAISCRRPVASGCRRHPRMPERRLNEADAASGRICTPFGRPAHRPIQCPSHGLDARHPPAPTSAIRAPTEQAHIAHTGASQKAPNPPAPISAIRAPTEQAHIAHLGAARPPTPRSASTWHPTPDARTGTASCRGCSGQ